MSYSVFKLRHLISIMDDNEPEALLSSFKCSAEPAAEHFLKSVAVTHEKYSISRTYLVLEEKNSDTKIIKGFFTPAVKCPGVKKATLFRILFWNE